MAERIGCFICTGCGIGESLDAAALGQAAAEAQAGVCEFSPLLCGREGRELVRKAIAEKNLEAVVIAACSGREHVADFTFPGVYVERASLRDGVTWSQPPRDPDTQALGEDVLRMALGKCKFAACPTAKPAPAEPCVLIIGGGISGLTAAARVARAGKKVVLVEREAQLGGFLKKLHRVFPRDAGIPAYPGPDLDALLQGVSENPAVTIYLESQVMKIQGAPGTFQVTLKTPQGEQQITVGAVIMAAGFVPYDAARLGHLGYGKSPDVVTSVEFEQMAAAGDIARPSDGKTPEAVVFIQCAGSRDAQHLSYCSNTCCPATLKQITYIKERLPETACYVVFKDIRAPGHYERIYQQVQKLGTLFVKGEVERVEPAEGKIQVTTTDVLLGEPLSITADLVVLATGMVPATLEQDLLRLSYRQGPELPECEGGFPNSHFICFPYETQRTAVYAAGTVRTPMDTTSCQEDATGAAAKALQALELISRGAATHPRVGDLSIPDFYLSRCTQCKRCTEECPFGALDEDVKGTPQPNPTRCRRCGVCLGACPERIVSFENYNIQMISQAIKSFSMPDEFEEKPRVLVFACENDALAALDTAARVGLKLNPFVRIIPLRCLGSFNIIWVADALSRGVDGIMLLGCRFGDDYQCHFIKGSELANTRMANVKDTLDRLMLEAERLRLEQVSISDWRKLPGLLDEFVEKIKSLGPNPYKG